MKIGSKCYNGLRISSFQFGNSVISLRFSQTTESPYERWHRQQYEKRETIKDDIKSSTGYQNSLTIKDQKLKLLGLAPGQYTKLELNIAYREKCKEYHPDTSETYNTEKFMELADARKYLIKHGFYKQEHTTWQKTGHYTCRSWADKREDDPEAAIYQRPKSAPESEERNPQNDWVPPDQHWSPRNQKRGPDYYVLASRILKSPMPDYYDVIQRWKLERAAQRNPVEHLVQTYKLYTIWALLVWGLLPYFGYFIRWSNAKLHGKEIPPCFRWEHVHFRFPFMGTGYGY